MRLTRLVLYSGLISATADLQCHQGAANTAEYKSERDCLHKE